VNFKGICSYYISIAQQVDAGSVEKKWKIIWSASQGLNWEIQEFPCVTTFFLVHPNSQPELEAVTTSLAQGRGQTGEKQCGGHSAANLAKSFRFLKSSRRFFVPIF